MLITHADNGITQVIDSERKIEYAPPVDGTYYHRETPRRVVDMLERCRRLNLRIRIHYGDVITGRDWLDEFDVTGRIGRSMGPIKVPLIISSSRSVGGPAILDSCIVRIKLAKQPYHTYYQHPAYHTGEFSLDRIDDETAYKYSISVDGVLHARFRNYEQARRYQRQFE